MEVFGEYLSRQQKFKTDRKKLALIFFVAACIVAIIVFWWLKLVGITVTGDAFCGTDEHTHIEECYEYELICGFVETEKNEATQSEETTAEETTAEETTAEETTAEETTAEETTAEETTAEETTAEEATERETDETDESTTVEEQADEITTAKPEEVPESSTEENRPVTASDINEVQHIHTEECYKKILVCTKTEHIHTPECFPDKTADTETVGEWLSTLENVEITNNIPENLIAVAMSQMGYEESKNNFEFDSDGQKNGYTRYGEWYGNPYGKWNTMFVSFCLHYSNINNVDELKAAGAEAMRLAWDNRHIYKSSEEYSPERGDLVFFNNTGDAAADTVGIILAVEKERLVVILGDSENKVETKTVDIDEQIIGYGLTGELHFAKDTEYVEEESTLTDIQPEEVPEFLPLMLMAADSEPDESHIHYVTDLSMFLVDIDIRTQDGLEISDGSTVYLGETYSITMEFKEDNEGDEWYQFGHNDEHYLTYDIPDNFHCEPFTEWHSITAITENGTVEDVGSYFIDENGHLLVTFNDGDDGLCFGHRYSNVDFTIEFNATVGATQSDGSSFIKFNEEISIKLNIDPTAEITVNKTHGTYNSKDNTLEYTIVVEATKAVVTELVVYDDIYITDKHHVLKDTIVVTDLNGNILDPQPTVSDGRGTAVGGFTLEGFPDFAAGEGYIITYKAAINDEFLGDDSVGLWNGAYPEGKDVNGNKVKADDDDWVKVDLSKIEKDGKQSIIKADDGTAVPVIEWEIEIKKTDSNLEGTVVVDTLGDGLEYYTGEPILIKRFDQWGNKLNDIYLDWSNVEVNNNSMSFELPEGYRFIIQYYTEYEQLQAGEQKHYTNTARVTINQKEEIAGGEADVVGFIPRLSKSASGDDGEYVYFTLEADVPAVIKDWGSFFLTDLAAFWSYKENAAGYLYVENNPEDLVITALTDSGRVVNFTPYVPGGPTENTYILVSPAEGDLHHSFNIFFNTADADSVSSKWILDENAVLTITYKIPFDAKTGVEWTGELQGELTLEDVLLKNYKLANEAYLNYTDIISATGVSTYEYKPSITKKSKANEDGIFDYTVTFYNTVPGSGGNQGYLTSANSIIFTDTFDEKLEYVEGSLTVTCFNPWDNSVWYNKYVYNGEISGNTMRVPANQLVLSQSNPDLPQGTISWIDNFTDYQKYCNQIGAGGMHIFTYKLKLKDEYLNTTEENKYVLDNTAELLWNGDNSSGPATDSVEYKTGLLDKVVIQENNKLDFDIHINRNALDILEGASTITIEDTMTQNLSLYWDTIKLFYEDENGNWIDFDSAESKHRYTVTYDQNSNRLTFVLPDELHMRIDYTTLVTQSGLISVNNAVRIEGKAQVTDIVDAVFKVEQHSGGASGSIHSITLIKQDGTTDVRLPDVTFYLYGPMGDKSATPPDGVPRTIVSESNKTLSYIGAYKTGADGAVLIESQYLTLDGPYALVEAAAPEGYSKLEKPTYFYFYETDPNGTIQTVTTLIAIENYTYGFVLPETGGTGTQSLAIIGFVLMTAPILYSIIRRKRERRFA